MPHLLNTYMLVEINIWLKGQVEGWMDEQVGG